MNNLTSDTGVVFDIHRFSLNDGPGIRTTIFLKGCPLSCKWCHNPESQSFKPELSFNAEKCINCYECVDACPKGAHLIWDGKHVFNRKLCDLSGNCVKVCSSGALKIIGKRYSVSDIISEVLKDEKYYLNTGGGVTISGGEPLAQFKFTNSLLAELKKYNIHTCIDTCGFAKQEYYAKVLLLTDLFLFDYKITLPEDHITFTGVDNSLILSNLDFLYNSGADIILRCPVIPGINDNDEHFNAIKKLSNKYPGLKAIQLMPYHNMGRDKSSFIGRNYELRKTEVPENPVKQKWVEYFRKEKIEVIME